MRNPMLYCDGTKRIAVFLSSSIIFKSHNLQTINKYFFQMSPHFKKNISNKKLILLRLLGTDQKKREVGQRPQFHKI